MMTDQNTSVPMAVPRRFKWVLGVSLALNLLVIGAVAGALMRGGPSGHGPRADRGGVKFAAPYIRALSSEDQRRVRRALRQNSPSRRDVRADREANFELMLNVLRAPEFDVTTARQILAAQTSASRQFQQAAQDQWIAVIANMPAAQRSNYADAVAQEIARAPKRRRDRRRRRSRD